MKEKNNVFNNMSNLLDMIDKFQTINNKSSSTENFDKENSNQINFESQNKFISSYSPTINLISSVVPHMPKNNKNTWLIILKILELQELLEISTNENKKEKENENLSKNTSDKNADLKDSNWQRKALVSAKPILSKESHETVDKIIQIMDLIETFTLMQQLNPNGKDI